mmetsp:Transcript_110340/g.297155  ORF Transcript_110340/g.297155 Transcript_110340/m.297155 type:complete len:560 (+) Transcript_110340:458-2137(+)
MGLGLTLLLCTCGSRTLLPAGGACTDGGVPRPCWSSGASSAAMRVAGTHARTRSPVAVRSMSRQTHICFFPSLGTFTETLLACRAADQTLRSVGMQLQWQTSAGLPFFRNRPFSRKNSAAGSVPSSVPQSPDAPAAVPVDDLTCTADMDGSVCALLRLERRSTWPPQLTQEHENLNEPAEASQSFEETEEQAEAEEIETIQHHLEEMNSAAGHLNSVQEVLNSCNKERRKLSQLWAVCSARLARAVGAHHLAKAAPYYDRRRRCQAVRLAVEAVSRKFMGAVEAQAPAADIDLLAAEHAARLVAFQAAQRELSRSTNGLSESLLSSVAPYFEAEDEHQEHLIEAGVELEHFHHAAAKAKARYQAALRGLEELSERAHRRRLESAEVQSSDRDSSAVPTPVSAGLVPNSSSLSRLDAHSIRDVDRRPSVDSSSSAGGHDVHLGRSPRAKTVSAASRKCAMKTVHNRSQKSPASPGRNGSLRKDASPVKTNSFTCRRGSPSKRWSGNQKSLRQILSVITSGSGGQSSDAGSHLAHDALPLHILDGHESCAAGVEESAGSSA